MNTPSKLYRVSSQTKVCKEPFVDWYEGESVEAALELAKEDAHRYGLPADTQFEVREASVEELRLLGRCQ